MTRLALPGNWDVLGAKGETYPALPCADVVSASTPPKKLAKLSAPMPMPHRQRNSRRVKAKCSGLGGWWPIQSSFVSPRWPTRYRLYMRALAVAFKRYPKSRMDLRYQKRGTTQRFETSMKIAWLSRPSVRDWRTIENRLLSGLLSLCDHWHASNPRTLAS